MKTMMTTMKRGNRDEERGNKEQVRRKQRDSATLSRGAQLPAATACVCLLA